MDHSKLWKILQEMGISEHLTSLPRNLHAGQEARVRKGHETKDWFQIGKEVCQGCILSLCLFNIYAEYIMLNAGWKKHKLELEKAEEPEINNIRWIIEKAREFQKNIYFCFIDYTKAFVWITKNSGKFLKRWEYQTT